MKNEDTRERERERERLSLLTFVHFTLNISPYITVVSVLKII